MIDVVILSYAKTPELEEVTRACLKSLMNSEDDALVLFTVWVVESQPGVFYSEFLNVRTVKPELPYGYHKFLNYGRKMGSGPYVCLCNNDLHFEKGWATAMLNAAEDNRQILSFSPYNPMTHPGRDIMPYTGLKEGYEVRVHVTGWCLFHNRRLYAAIGDLDEDFVHWYADDDFAMTLKKHGVRHALVTDSLVSHHDDTYGTTSKLVLDEVEFLNLTDGAKRTFLRKWYPQL